MNGFVWAGVGLVVLLLVVLLVSGGKNKDAKKPAKTGDLAETQRQMWAEAEEAITAYTQARGHQVGPARERMLRLADDVRPDSPRLAGAAVSERQRLMWGLAADEIRALVDEALARHPEDQQV